MLGGHDTGAKRTRRQPGVNIGETRARWRGWDNPQTDNREEGSVALEKDRRKNVRGEDPKTPFEIVIVARKKKRKKNDGKTQ